mgnify:CR=1 FL=1
MIHDWVWKIGEGLPCSGKMDDLPQNNTAHVLCKSFILLPCGCLHLLAPNQSIFRKKNPAFFRKQLTLQGCHRPAGFSCHMNSVSDYYWFSLALGNSTHEFDRCRRPGQNLANPHHYHFARMYLRFCHKDLPTFEAAKARVSGPVSGWHRASVLFGFFGLDLNPEVASPPQRS